MKPLLKTKKNSKQWSQTTKEKMSELLGKEVKLKGLICLRNKRETCSYEQKDEADWWGVTSWKDI